MSATQGQLAQATASLGTSLFAGMAKVKNAQAQEAQTNEQIKIYNKQLLQKNAEDINAIQLQRSVSRMQTVQALFAVERKRVEEVSAKNTMLAATDTVGASARQSIMAAEAAAEESKNVYILNQRLTEESLDAQIGYTTSSTKYSLQQLKYGAGKAAANEASAANFGAIMNLAAVAML